MDASSTGTGGQRGPAKKILLSSPSLPSGSTGAAPSPWVFTGIEGSLRTRGADCWLSGVVSASLEQQRTCKSAPRDWAGEQSHGARPGVWARAAL